MIIPIITSLSREVIETTPPGDKEGALALGCDALGDDRRRRSSRTARAAWSAR